MVDSVTFKNQKIKDINYRVIILVTAHKINKILIDFYFLVEFIVYINL